MKKKTVIKIVIVIIILALLGTGAYFAWQKWGKVDDEFGMGMGMDGMGGMGGMEELMQEPAFIGMIENKISASSPVKPANQYEVSSLVKGKIISAKVEEGDIVKKDDVLYEIEDTETDKNILAAKKKVDEAVKAYDELMKDYDKLNVKSKEAGNIIELDVKVGDEVASGQRIGKIENRKVMKLVVQFLREDAKSFYVGQPAKVIMQDSFEEIPATVSEISSLDEVLKGNSIVRKVTVEVNNPGGIANEAMAVAYVDGKACSAVGKFEYKSSRDLNAEASGKVLAINRNLGDFVTEADVIVSLSGEDMDKQLEAAGDNIKEAREGLKSAKSAKDEYIIKSPTNGTIIEKVSKQGDNITSGTKMMTIYDMSYLTFDMQVMENDIKKIKVGQEVQVYGNQGEFYMGEVTRVGINGQTDSFTTKYPITVVIKEAEGLLPGMNVRADIITDFAENVLMIPVSAVVRGDLVLVTTDSPSAANAIEGEMAPEGYVYVSVVSGISDRNYVEIKEGLVEGDVVGYQHVENGMGGYGGFGSAIAEEVYYD